MDETCIFCKIIKGDIPSYTVYEDEKVKVFLDINPNTNGHMLVIPKDHTKDIETISEETLLEVIRVAKNMKKLAEDKLSCDGVSLCQNNGIAQDVKHFHMHVIPKYNDKQELKDVKEVFDILTK